MLIQIFGALGLILRYWLVNYKLKAFLQHRVFHLSRFLSFIFFISMVLEFGKNLFTLIIIGAYPTMIVAFTTFDIAFYKSVFKQDWYERFTQLEIGDMNQFDPKDWKFKLCVLAERLTVHIPIIIVVTIIFITQPLPNWYPQYGIISMLLGFSFIATMYLGVDPRWVKIEVDGQKNEWPSGKYILYGMIAESLFFAGLFIIEGGSLFWNGI